MAADGCPPYNSLVDAYKHLSAHPKQWQLVYGFSNNRVYDMIADVYLKLMCERAIRNRIKSYNPDVVVSVHPLMTKVPVAACHKISSETDKHLPMFTVVTDLGSGHSLWFANEVEKVFIASDQIRQLAKRGKVPDEKIVQAGLPIRHDFAVQADALGDRMSEEGKAYQQGVRRALNLSTEPSAKTILVMGGGEGVGSLSSIVDALYVELTNSGIDATIVVVCGRNEHLRRDLETRDWDAVLSRRKHIWRGIYGATTDLIQLLAELTFSGGDKMGFLSNVGHEGDSVSTKGRVKVVGLGFISRMAEYMVAADVLVSKAGPGTIAEAAAVGLPVMLTSYLPGQEEGNVDFVIDGGFGAYQPDYEPTAVAKEVTRWLTDIGSLRVMSRRAKSAGAPNAASDIVRSIGESTLRWKDANESSLKV